MVGKQISADELFALINNGLDANSVVVDVRTKEEFKKGAISGAINISVDEIQSRFAELKNYETIYLYCLSGGRSELALLQLQRTPLKADLINLSNGLLAWRKQGHPLQ